MNPWATAWGGEGDLSHTLKGQETLNIWHEPYILGTENNINKDTEPKLFSGSKIALCLQWAEKQKLETE